MRLLRGQEAAAAGRLGLGLVSKQGSQGERAKTSAHAVEKLSAGGISVGIQLLAGMFATVPKHMRVGFDLSFRRSGPSHFGHARNLLHTFFAAFQPI
jgi:hypothetical protein